MDIKNRLETKDVELSTGDTITVRELSHVAHMAIQKAGLDEDALAGPLVLWYGVPEFKEKYSSEEIGENLTMKLVTEIAEHVWSFSGLNEDPEKNSESTQSEDSPSS